MCVRTSKAFYGSFILDMDRSPGFGSALRDLTPFSDLVSLRVRMSSSLPSPRAATRRTVLQKVRGRALHSVTLPPVVNTGFQVLFHSPPGVLFTFPSRYLFTIGHWVVFSLGGWSPRLPTRFPVSRGTPDSARRPLLRLRGFHALRQAFPKPFRFDQVPDCSP